MTKLYLSDDSVCASSSISRSRACPCQPVFQQHLQNVIGALSRSAFTNFFFFALYKSQWVLRNVPFITQVKYHFFEHCSPCQMFLLPALSASLSSEWLRSVPRQGTKEFDFSRCFILRGCGSTGVEALTGYSQQSKNI